MRLAPPAFHGTLARLYDDHIAAVLPPPAAVRDVHAWMEAYCSDASPVFPVRAVRGAERRRVYRTADGTAIAPADNSPAWVIHSALLSGGLRSYADFVALMSAMPAHMFDIPKCAAVGETANAFGWYVAHLAPAKDGNTDFRSWDRREVERRFFRALHPANLFFVPAPAGRSLGENPDVIRYVASRFHDCYGATWLAFLERAGATIAGDPSFGEMVVTLGPKAGVDPGSAAARAGGKMVRYRAARLRFVRKKIEPLGSEDSFEVVTPMGTYRFTKAAFYEAFPNIVRSASYREAGYYHGADLHLKAQAFRVG